MKKLLIIDDDINVLKNLKIAFNKENYLVETANCGYFGLEMFKKNPSHIVITDLFLPDLNGIEIIKEIKGSYPTVSIIITSGEFYRDGLNYDKIALHSGAEYAIPKPIDFNKLFDIVDYILAN